MQIGECSVLGPPTQDQSEAYTVKDWHATMTDNFRSSELYKRQKMQKREKPQE